MDCINVSGHKCGIHTRNKSWFNIVAAPHCPKTAGYYRYKIEEMYEKILVPLDGSILAEVALPYAEELAGRLCSEITLLSVADSAEAQDYHKHLIYIEKTIGPTKRRAERFVKKPEGKAIKVSSEILVGHPAEKIVDYADIEGIDLAIMATHGRSGVKRWALGSVADKVARATKRPVVLVRAKNPHRNVTDKCLLNKVLVPLDGSKESEAVIPYIKELASKLTLEVTLLQVLAQPYHHAYADAEGYIEKMVNAFKGKGITTESEISAGSAAEEIIKLADEASIDMIAMSTHGQSGVSRWALGGVANRILQGGNTPILLVRTPETSA